MVLEVGWVVAIGCDSVLISIVERCCVMLWIAIESVQIKRRSVEILILGISIAGLSLLGICTWTV